MLVLSVLVSGCSQENECPTCEEPNCPKCSTKTETKIVIWYQCYDGTLKEELSDCPKIEVSQTSTTEDTSDPGYICSYNAYNCANFGSQASAQKAFNACGGITNDIHDLDRDSDGIACESLP